MPQLDISKYTKPVPLQIEAPQPQSQPEPQVIEGEVTSYAEPEFEGSPGRDREELEVRGQLQTLVQGIVPHGPLRALHPETLTSKWKLLEQLGPTIPLNEYDLPTYVYRADMLDHEAIQEMLLELKGVTPQVHLTVEPDTSYNRDTPAPSTKLPVKERVVEILAQLESAMVPLTYYEGFPVQPSGMPFWNQLQFEPQDAYDAFIFYLEDGASRAIHKLIAYPIDQVKEWFHLYYWPIRVQAFERYRLANAQKIRLHRMLATEDDHYKRSEKLLKAVGEVLASFDADAIKEVGFEKLIGVFGKLAEIQRISAGLPAKGGVPLDEQSRAPTTQIIMQQIAQNSPQKRAEVADQDDFLDDPETLEAAQDLILKSQQAKPVND